MDERLALVKGDDGSAAVTAQGDILPGTTRAFAALSTTRRLCSADHRFSRLTFAFAGEESRQDPENCLSLASHVLPHRTFRPAR